MAMEKVKIGVIGCGMISRMYIKNLTQMFQNTEVVAVSDTVFENALYIKEKYGIARACADNKELLEMEEIKIVVILTPPSQHYKNVKDALDAGKHVYVEKPLALTRKEGKELLETAGRKNLMLSCAPDTILGAGIQMCRKLIDEGWIGRPFGVTCQTLIGGHESWHPNPEFFYKEGAGPLYDVGPYYLSAMSYLLGPVESVMCYTQSAFDERMITSEPNYGEKIKVEVPTYVQAQMKFRGGALASIINTFDVKYTKQNNHVVEIYGSKGTLVVPSPCYFDGQILYRGNDMEGFKEIPAIFSYHEDSRGLGVSDMASAILNQRQCRLTKEMAYHTLDVMEAFYDSDRTNQRVEIRSDYKRTEPMDFNVQAGVTG